ncbi:hypothetical protein NDU88_002319 [Pleurodeles waltl]|uniref:Uncharacterized protein n=1 Tax=Pleurodeles waltl TaxID=8319 RepID=A0AAV7UYB8_PLEWA|nr:hypothetical protein NDU88_002319 [Pleurodeles waltl]
MAELKKLCKERGLALEKEAIKMDFRRALKAYKEIRRMQTATIPQESNDHEEKKVDVEEEDEAGDGMVKGQEQQQEEEHLPSGVSSPAARSIVSLNSLSTEELVVR